MLVCLWLAGWRLLQGLCFACSNAAGPHPYPLPEGEGVNPGQRQQAQAQSLSPVTLRYQPRWCCLAQARVTVPYIIARMVPRVQMAA